MSEAFPSSAPNQIPVDPGFSFGPPPVAERLPGMRPIEVDGHTVYTDLPDGVVPFEAATQEKNEHPYYRGLDPAGLDSLPNGDFHISSPDDPDPRSDRLISVTQDADGKYVTSLETAERGLYMNNIGNNSALLMGLGYKVEEAEGRLIVCVPTPNTIQARAAELGVSIRFFPDQTLIDSRDYLGTFADGEYPVAMGNAEYYTHDTQDDHLTAMVLGGEPLKLALAQSANEALASGADLDKHAGDIDEFTAYLRGTVSPTLNSSDLPYGLEMIQAAGRRIGLASEQVDEIVSVASQNAEEFGMELRSPAALPSAA